MAIEINQVLKSVSLHLTNYVGEIQKFNILKSRSIISCLLEMLKILCCEDRSASQVLSNALYHYIEQFDFLDKPRAQKYSK